MSAFHLAQVNIAHLKAPMDAPETRDFADNLDRINALAESQPGFVWRLVGDGGNATDIQAFDDPMMIVNMSLWTDIESLAAFVYRTGHRDIMRRRREWFFETETYQALWWTPAGTLPTVADAKARLKLLADKGPTDQAFTFKTPFAAPDMTVAPSPVLEECA